ncbi:hypothetical protein [Luteimonas marina]|nr:hypothetical protein [Luteimonas marina]
MRPRAAQPKPGGIAVQRMVGIAAAGRGCDNAAMIPGHQNA